MDVCHGRNYQQPDYNDSLFFFSQIPSSYDVILEDTEKVIPVLKPICKAFDKTAAKSGI